MGDTKRDDWDPQDALVLQNQRTTYDKMNDSSLLRSTSFQIRDVRGIRGIAIAEKIFLR